MIGREPLIFSRPMQINERNQLRLEIRQRRLSLTASEREAAADIICKTIEKWPRYQDAKTLALYQHFSGEIDLSAVWYSCQLLGKICCFPVITADKRLLFLPVNKETVFKKNKFGIQEPQLPSSQAIPPKELELVFVPLVAFDSMGTRLGMGAGFYDRTFAGMISPPLIGVAYEFQKQPFIEPKPWDVPLSAIITEKKLYWTDK